MNGVKYCCIDCKGEELKVSEEGLSCINGHFFPFLKDSKVPVFAISKKNINEYTISEAANIHDNSLEWLLS